MCIKSYRIGVEISIGIGIGSKVHACIVRKGERALYHLEPKPGSESCAGSRAGDPELNKFNNERIN